VNAGLDTRTIPINYKLSDQTRGGCMLIFISLEPYDISIHSYYSHCEALTQNKQKHLKCKCSFVPGAVQFPPRTLYEHHHNYDDTDYPIISHI
jgi:hypothetical protein